MTYHIKNFTSESRKLSNDSAGFYVDDANNLVITDRCEETTVAMKREGNYSGMKHEGLVESGSMEVKELFRNADEI